MGDYICRDMAIARLTKVEVTNRLATMTDAKREIAEMPAADVALVVYGRWLHTDLAYHWTSLDECSVCGYHDEKRRHLGDYSYCPHCGAKMEEGTENAKPM